MKPFCLALSVTILASASSSLRAGELFDFEPSLDSADLYRGGGSGDLTLAGDSFQALAQAGPAPSASLASTLTPLTLGADDRRNDKGSYVSARLGPLWFLEDLEDLDTGLNAELAFGYRVLRILALELQSGYFWGEDGSDAELWGIPVVLNAKLIIPILFLEVYGGVGIGGYYINTETGPLEEEDFVLGGNLFLGAGLDVGPVGLGLEGKYIHTDDFDVGAGRNPNLQGFTVMAYVNFQF